VKGELKDLFRLDAGILFFGAQEIARTKKVVYCLPNVIDHDSRTNLGCLRCNLGFAITQCPEYCKAKTVEEIITGITKLEQNGVDRLILTSAWMGYELPDDYYECVARVKEKCPVDVYAQFGALNRSSLCKLKKAGLDGYLCNLDSPNRKNDLSFQYGYNFSDRMKTLKEAKEVGLKTWSGFFVGMGETDEDIAIGLTLLQLLEVHSLQILPFIPFPCSRMIIDNNREGLVEWARILAIARIFLQEPDLFAYQATGSYYAYAVMGGGNGFYILS
jgi:biotin synthase